MVRTKNPRCIYCRSSKVIKHGKTLSGHSRYRCRVCGKTWVPDKKEKLRPDISDIVVSYLSGRTYRDLVKVYHSSPLRINQKIREFLEGVPNWEDFFDACTTKNKSNLILLLGKEFACACKNSDENRMYLAVAFDALSNAVIGYEIDTSNSCEVWNRLLKRLKLRGIKCPSFMTNGNKNIESSVESVYPRSSLKIIYHRSYRNRELQCCLSRSTVNNKLINDAINSFETLHNENLKNYLNKYKEHRFSQIIHQDSETYIKRLTEKMKRLPINATDEFWTLFQNRFEKFHMLKDDPFPVVNGWIAKYMLTNLDIGFNRLSLHNQIPSEITFKSFACGNKPKIVNLEEGSEKLHNFLFEIAANAVKMPIFYFNCEMKLDKCSLII